MGQMGFTSKDTLSMGQMAVVLDHSPVAVLVSTADDKKVLYSNRQARELFPGADTLGEACYAAVGFDGPCPFCSEDKMSRSELQVREYHDPRSRRIYQFSGMLVDWDGQDAHIEYIQDITDKKQSEERFKKVETELTSANRKMEDIINAIPGGVAIYKVSDHFETVYFSEGVLELSGYTAEEYREIVKWDVAELICPDDVAMVLENLREAARNRTAADFEFRKRHKEGHVVWVHIQAWPIGEEDGIPLLQCVFHNITALRETQRELDHLVNSIPGGIASYRVEEGQFIPTFFSDGIMTLSGHTREEYEEIVRNDAMDIVYEPDRPRVAEAAKAAIESGDVLDVSYRMYHKNGNLIWIHLNGRRIGPLSESIRFYAVFTSMLLEEGSSKEIADEAADGIYIIDKESYELLYVKENKKLGHSNAYVGQKCYTAMYGADAPCEFCTLGMYGPDNQEHEVIAEGSDRICAMRIKEAIWNGIQVYVQYLRDVTEEVRAREEKERLEMYCQTLINNLPGGISVIRCWQDGTMTPEFISEGFAAITRMTVDEAFELYREDVFNGVHPDDVPENKKKVREFMESGAEHCELNARFKRGDGGYVWVRDRLSTQAVSDGSSRLYCFYADIDQLVEEKHQLRQQYEELILQHYRTPGPDTLILGHCDITKNEIIEIWDVTGSDRLNAFGRERESFFTGIAGMIEDEEERRLFLDTYLAPPLLEAFGRKETERTSKCFVKMPGEQLGRYVRFKVNMVEAPDTGNVTGFLSVTDITDQIISERILRRLSVTSHDYVVDLDLGQDSYTILTSNENACMVPPPQGIYSQRVAFMAREAVVPKDREVYVKALDPEEMERRLKETGLYIFAYSLVDEDGIIRTKNMTVSAIDLRLKRISLVCTDITSSVREQQSLLSILAYTFELAGMINVSDRSFVMYTRQMILENLPPYLAENYEDILSNATNAYEDGEDVKEQLRLEAMKRRLEKTPAGYELVFAFHGKEGLRYKQLNVLWGDRNRGTICLVRADVTEMLAAERQSKNALEKGLALAEEANRAKSDFLSAMSHDIRTPMNGIMGMTALAEAHLDDRERVADCLQKISISSKHLLSLVNDVLDMSRIERAQIPLNRVRISLSELVDQLAAMIVPQAKAAGLQFDLSLEGISHPAFYGDTLRINQILINLLSNAVKFTPEGGRVEFRAEEIPPVGDTDRARYCFTVSDTGIGMTEEFLARIFEPFARDYGVMRIEGTGLGLSIAHGLVELMQGTISVESCLNKGSTFRVELEFEIAQDREDSSSEAQGMVSGPELEKIFPGRCFLVAEDNMLNSEILCEILQMHGIKPVIKADGAQALQAFTDAAPGTYDGILMDIQMPNMNGYEAARAIRSLDRPDARLIPIIALTANAFAEDIQLALNAGMTAHVAKPIDVDVLLTTLSKVLE